MKRILVLLLPVALVALTGCPNTSPPGGNTNRANNANNANTNNTVVGSPDETFKLTANDLSLKQGESKAHKIGITRGKDFKDDVALSFSGAPMGVTLDPSAPTIKAGDPDATVNVKADDKAGLGDHTITVTGKPKTGKDTSVSFKLSVTAK